LADAVTDAEAFELSPLFADGGRLVVAKDSSQRIQSLEREEVIRLFEAHGVVLFRGFDLPADSLTGVTDPYTETYASDAVRRVERFGPRGEVREVDAGRQFLPLHSEASFGSVWPEIVWFYCSVPSSSGGYTTLCDGVRVWEGLSRKTQAYFVSQPVRYQIAFPTGSPQPGRGREPWPFMRMGVSGEWDRDKGVFHLQVLRYAVNEARNRKLAFANHVLCEDDQIEQMTMADGRAVPSEITAEIEAVEASLTFDVEWQARDLAMIDNRRFLHGRRASAEDDKRDVLQIQTLTASFAYGVNGRSGIER
jgi:alpha-ketoglutarate-dependent taurine dioxygenase